MPWIVDNLPPVPPPVSPVSMPVRPAPASIDIEFSGVLGGKNSQLGFIQSAYDQGDYFFIDWIRNASLDNGTIEQDFGTDEGGNPIKLLLGTPKTLTRSQMNQAIDNGAIILEAARYKVGDQRLILYEVFTVTDSGLATVARSNLENWLISDSASRIFAFHRISSDILAAADFASPAGLRFRSGIDSTSISDVAAIIAIAVHISQMAQYRSQVGSLFQLGVS